MEVEAACTLYFEPKLWSHRYGEGIFTISINSVEVIETSFAQYTLEIKWGGHTKTIQKRFSDFYRLQTVLKTEKVIDTIAFPAKTWFSNVDKQFLQARLLELSKWLEMALTTSKTVALHASVRSFFELDRLH